MLRRTWAITQKEFIQLWRFPLILIGLTVGPAIELILFAVAIHTDVKHIPMVVADQSLSTASRSYLMAFTDSSYFVIVTAVPDQASVILAIDSGQASIGLVIPVDFATRIEQNNANVLMLVDGSNSFVTQSAYTSAAAISQQYAVRLSRQQLSPVHAHIQILYNPDLQDLWFIVPGFGAFLLYGIALKLTAFAIVRERESGTIEALLVTPIRPIVLFAILAGLFAIGSLGLGLVISSVSQSQVQANQLASLMNIAVMFLSGFLFPAYALPLLLRIFGYIMPMTFFMPIVNGIITKGVGLGDLWVPVLSLTGLTIAIFFVGARSFRQKLD